MRDRFFGSHPQKLDDLKQTLLKRFEPSGLREEHLIPFNVKASDGWHERPFLEVAALLFNQYKLPPQQVIAEMNNLYFYQAFALRDCYPNGLRGDHLRNWEQGAASEFYMNFWSVLVKLIQEKHVDPELAVSLLDHQTSRAMVEIENEALARLAAHNKDRYINFDDGQFGSPVFDRFRPN